MAVELLKLFLALGTGALTALLGYFTEWVPPETTSGLEYAILTVAVAVIKRSLDYLASKTTIPAFPTSLHR